MVFCLIFLFSNHPSKYTGSPLREAEVKAVKVVNFVAMWLNLNPHTVFPFLLLFLYAWSNNNYSGWMMESLVIVAQWF